MKILISIFILLLLVLIHMFRFEYYEFIMNGKPITMKTDRLLNNHCIYAADEKMKKAYSEWSGLDICK